MDFRLHSHELPGAGVSRALLEQIDLALARLAPAGAPQLSAEQVHDARKFMKRARSTMRLVRLVFPDELAAANRTLAGAARELSPWRDADALVEAFDRLVATAYDGESHEPGRQGVVDAGGCLPPLFPKVRAALVANRGPAHLGLDARSPMLRRVLRGIRGTRRRLAMLDTTRIDGVGLSGGLKRVRRGVRKAMRQALSGRGADGFHEWRKHVKHFWYATALLSEIWPVAAAGLQADLKRLAAILGDDHDLAVLRDWVMARAAASLFDSPEEQIAFVMLLDSTQEELRGDAIEIGRRIGKVRQKGLRELLDRCGAPTATTLATALARADLSL